MFRENSPKYTRDFEHVDYLGVPSAPSGKARQGKMGCSLSCTGVFWSLLSFLAMLASTIAFIAPYWLQGELRLTGSEINSTQTFFGLWRRCNYYALSADGQSVEIMDGCGRYATFLDIPSLWWQISSVAVCVGCVISVFLGFYSMCACCVDHVMTKSLAQALGVCQLLAGISIGAGCVLFPFGWENNNDILQACGPDASVYRPGDCTIGWAYWLCAASAGCTVIAALLACHAAKSKTRLRYDRVGL